MDSPTILSALKLPICAIFGAFILYILNRLHNKVPFSLFTALNIDVSPSSGNWLAILFDMILSSVIGGIAIFFISSPLTIPQAIIGGLGMTGILSAHAKPEEKNLI